MKTRLSFFYIYFFFFSFPLKARRKEGSSDQSIIPAPMIAWRLHQNGLLLHTPKSEVLAISLPVCNSSPFCERQAITVTRTSGVSTGSVGMPLLAGLSYLLLDCAWIGLLIWRHDGLNCSRCWFKSAMSQLLMYKILPAFLPSRTSGGVLYFFHLILISSLRIELQSSYISNCEEEWKTPS